LIKKARRYCSSGAGFAKPLVDAECKVSRAAKTDPDVAIEYLPAFLAGIGRSAAVSADWQLRFRFLALTFHAKPVCADAAVYSDGTGNTAAGVGALGVELTYDAHLRGVSAVHFEAARGRAELHHQCIDVLAHILITQTGGNFLTRCGAPAQRNAQRASHQNSHF
jgi:hypothetical protein